MKRFLEIMALKICRKRMVRPGFRKTDTTDIAIVIEFIYREVRSRGNHDSGSVLGVFLPECPGETGL